MKLSFHPYETVITYLSAPLLLEYFCQTDHGFFHRTVILIPVSYTHLGKYDQARNYYKKILDNQPHAQDLLNAGHTEWALQNIKGALSICTACW